MVRSVFCFGGCGTEVQQMLRARQRISTPTTTQQQLTTWRDKMPEEVTASSLESFTSNDFLRRCRDTKSRAWDCHVRKNKENEQRIYSRQQLQGVCFRPRDSNIKIWPQVLSIRYPCHKIRSLNSRDCRSKNGIQRDNVYPYRYLDAPRINWISRRVFLCDIRTTTQYICCSRHAP